MKIMISLILLLLFCGCSVADDSCMSLTVEYSGECYVSIENNDIVYFVFCNENRTWSKDELVSVVGQLKTINIKGIKVYGHAYPDQGTLKIIINNNGEIIESVATLGTQTAILNYTF
jgi:hypothetical protein